MPPLQSTSRSTELANEPALVSTYDSTEEDPLDKYTSFKPTKPDAVDPGAHADSAGAIVLLLTEAPDGTVPGAQHRNAQRIAFCDAHRPTTPY